MFRCPKEDCCATFTQKFTLQQHLHVHYNYECYVCNIGNCKQKFCRSTQLWSHKQKHLKNQI